MGTEYKLEVLQNAAKKLGILGVTCDVTRIGQDLVFFIHSVAKPIKILVIPEGVSKIRVRKEVQPKLEKLLTKTMKSKLEEQGVMVLLNIFKTEIKVEHLKIPGTVKEIEDKAFWNVAGIEKITIGEGCKRIGMGAFYLCETVKIDLPESLEVIEDYAFRRSSLMEIKIPKQVKKIGTSVLKGCQELKSVEIEGNLEEIQEEAFSMCKGLVDVELPKSCVQIGERAFKGCSNIRHIEFPDSLEVIGSAAFVSCRLTEITLPKSLRVIDNSAFHENELERVTLSEGIETIGHNAFFMCHSLKDINFPSTLKSIGKWAFNLCSLRSVALPR